MKTIIIFIKNMNAAGGIERVISNLVEIWHKNNKVIILVKDNEKKSFYYIPKDIDFISINEPLILNMNNRIQRIFSVFVNFVKSHNKLKKTLNSISFDYIYTTTPLNALEVYLCNSKYKNKMIISEHASAFAVNGIYQKIKRFVYPKAYCVSVPNKTDVEIYKKWGCNTFYIPHLLTFKDNEKNILNTRIVLNVGRYTADKRQYDLIKIWSKLQNKNNWKLWIVGSGEEEKNLADAIKEFNVSKTVTLMPHTNSIQDIYKKASLFVFTSRMEGFGMVLLEAMSFGIPCISYDCPSGPRDVIVDSYNGRLVENGNMDEFISVLQEFLLLSDEEIEKYGYNALETVKRWDNNLISKKWDEIFDNSKNKKNGVN